jgi:hypothetical protein
VVLRSHQHFKHTTPLAYFFRDDPLHFAEFIRFGERDFFGTAIASVQLRKLHIGITITGSLTGACLGIAGNAAAWLAVVIGAIGSLVGAFGGYRSRAGLVRALHAPDFAIAIPEDLVAIGLGLLLVSRF